MTLTSCGRSIRIGASNWLQAVRKSFINNNRNNEKRCWKILIDAWRDLFILFIMVRLPYECLLCMGASEASIHPICIFFQFMAWLLLIRVLVQCMPLWHIS